MGFFDAILKDLASGDLDKKLLKVADTVERFSEKMDDTVKNLAEKPEQLSKNVDAVSHKAVKTVQTTINSIDGVHKRS